MSELNRVIIMKIGLAGVLAWNLALRLTNHHYDFTQLSLSKI